MASSENPINANAESAESSVDTHIQNTKDLLLAAENFVGGAEDSAELTVSAEKFIGSAQEHIQGAESLAGTAEDHIGQLSEAMNSAESHVQELSDFVGAETGGGAAEA